VAAARWSENAAPGHGATDAAGTVPDVPGSTAQSDARYRQVSHGLVWGVAALVTAGLLIGALAAARVDLNSPLERNPVPLENSATVSKLVAAAGLLLLARMRRSVSILTIAGVVLLLAVEGRFHALGLLDGVVAGPARSIAAAFSISRVFVASAIPLAVAGMIIALLLAYAVVKAGPEDRRLVLSLVLLLAIDGIFAGPVNAISSLGITREWLFAEDFGQAVALALLAGYVSGAVMWRYRRDHAASSLRTR
jgi:hypothetical protein